MQRGAKAPLPLLRGPCQKRRFMGVNWHHSNDEWRFFKNANNILTAEIVPVVCSYIIMYLFIEQSVLRTCKSLNAYDTCIMSISLERAA